MQNSQVLITGCKKSLEFKRKLEKMQNPPWKSATESMITCSLQASVNPIGPAIVCEEENRTKLSPVELK